MSRLPRKFVAIVVLHNSFERAAGVALLRAAQEDHLPIMNKLSRRQNVKNTKVAFVLK